MKTLTYRDNGISFVRISKNEPPLLYYLGESGSLIIFETVDDDFQHYSVWHAPSARNFTINSNSTKILIGIINPGVYGPFDQEYLYDDTHIIQAEEIIYEFQSVNELITDQDYNLYLFTEHHHPLFPGSFIVAFNKNNDNIRIFGEKKMFNRAYACYFEICLNDFDLTICSNQKILSKIKESR